MAFSANGRTLASGGDDGVILEWDIDVRSWRALACQIAGRSPQPGERKLYLAGMPSWPWRPRLQESCVEDALRRADAHALARLAGKADSIRTELREAVEMAQRLGHAATNNSVYWIGSISGLADVVLPACEQAVSLAVGKEQWLHRDSRGVALTLLHQYEQAKQDFLNFVEQTKDDLGYAPSHDKRRKWTGWRCAGGR